MDITTVFGTVIGGSSPSGNTKKHKSKAPSFGFVLAYQSYLKIKLNKYPVKIIPIPTTPAKIKINLGFIIFLRIINSGNDKAVTDIIKESAVPIATPFSVNALTKGIIPAALEYKGIPTKAERGTAYQLPAPTNFAKKPEGT